MVFYSLGSIMLHTSGITLQLLPNIERAAKIRQTTDMGTSWEDYI